MPLSKRLGALCTRLAAVFIVAGILWLVPDPAFGTVLPYKSAVVCFAVVVLTGKALFDTFFFDHPRW
jgi:hypothetical protein